MCSLQMTGVAWTMPAPAGEAAVSPSAGLGSDPPMMHWERITDRLKTAFPQQTRYLILYLVVSKDHTPQFRAIINIFSGEYRSYSIVHSHDYSNAPFQKNITHTQKYRYFIMTLVRK